MGQNRQKRERPSRKAVQKQDITVRRKGGGTLIENRPVFSHDGKYVYVNCFWGVKIFSVKTGECVRVLESGQKIAAVLSYDKGPLTIACDGSVVKWEPHSNRAENLSVQKFELLPKFWAIDAHLVPNIYNPNLFDICIVMRSKNSIRLMFYDPATGNIVDHPMNRTLITYVGIKHNISFGGFKDRVIYASIVANNLNVCAIDGSEAMMGQKCTDGRSWTCVRCHENETVVAAGDSGGRVFLWRNPFYQSNSPVQCVYHWHTLPCRDIALTPAGTSMYTGGGEHVLVKWNVENPLIRNYLPRLSAEIEHITVSPDNLLVAVSTLDNGIQIVESHNRLRCILQQFTWGVVTIPGTELFPAGLNYDSRTGAIVLNGRPGHLQFYSPQSESLLFNVDITQRNILTQERNKVITNTEITHCSLSSDGFWMATIETRHEEGIALEIRLKFWQFIPSKQRFSLTTSVEKPHNGFAFGMQFRPGSTKVSSSSEINLDYMLATTGSDKKFRIWTPADIDSIYKKGVVWGCESVGFYRDKDCGLASFSEDGSLLAVSFVESLTIWDIDNINLKTSITRLKKPIKSVQFGKQECCHLVVTCTDEELHVWNLLTLTLVWFVRIKPFLHISDPCSYFQAIFTKDGRGFVFNPLERKPVYEFKYDNQYTRIVCAAFIPRETVSRCNVPWLQQSQLYYIDSNQELKVFECEEENSGLISVPIIQDKPPSTLFSSLVAAQQTSNAVQDQKQKYLQFGVLGAGAITELLKAPAHTMPPISLLCGSLLQSLILTKKKVNDENVNMDIPEDEGIAEPSSDTDDEMEAKKNSQSLQFLPFNLEKTEKNKTQIVSKTETEPFSKNSESVPSNGDKIGGVCDNNNDDDDDDDDDDEEEMNMELEFFEDVKGDIDNFSYK